MYHTTASNRIKVGWEEDGRRGAGNEIGSYLDCAVLQCVGAVAGIDPGYRQGGWLKELVNKGILINY